MDDKGYIIICKNDNGEVLGYFGGHIMNELKVVDNVCKAEIFTDMYKLHIAYERLVKYHTKNTYISEGSLTWTSASIRINITELV